MKRKIISLLVGTLIVAGSSSASLALSDLGGHWSEDSIKELISENVINGYDDGTFRPDEFISREQTAKIADTYFNKLLVDKNLDINLADIHSRWSEKHIKKLVSAGIVTGYPDGTFVPDGYINRSEVAAIAYKALKNTDKYVNRGIDVNLNDISGNWAEENIKALVQMGVIKGYNDGSFKPDNFVTRAEVASIFNKMNVDYGIRNGNALGEEEKNRYFKLYSGVLERYYDLISGNRTDYDYENGETGVYEILIYNNEGEGPNNIGYAIEDISGDNVPELLIGVVNPESSPHYHGETILAAYTIADGSPVLSFDGWIRSNYRYIGDGSFYYYGSGGAMHTSFGTFTLTPDGRTLNCNQYYFTDEKEEGTGTIGFYYNEFGVADKSGSMELHITSDDFWDIDPRPEKKYYNIKLTPFSKYEDSKQNIGL